MPISLSVLAEALLKHLIEFKQKNYAMEFILPISKEEVFKMTQPASNRWLKNGSSEWKRFLKIDIYVNNESVLNTKQIWLIEKTEYRQFKSLYGNITLLYSWQVLICLWF